MANRERLASELTSRPLPPHITLKDAAHFLTMMLDGPELGSVLKNSAKQIIASVLPGKDRA